MDYDHVPLTAASSAPLPLLHPGGVVFFRDTNRVAQECSHVFQKNFFEQEANVERIPETVRVPVFNAGDRE